MKYDTSVFKGSEEVPNKVSGALWKTFHNFGKLGEYRVLAQTEECVVIRLENETGEGDMVLYQVFDGIFLMYNDFHMSQYINRGVPMRMILTQYFSDNSRRFFVRFIGGIPQFTHTK